MRAILALVLPCLFVSCAGEPDHPASLPDPTGAGLGGAGPSAGGSSSAGASGKAGATSKGGAGGTTSAGGTSAAGGASGKGGSTAAGASGSGGTAGSSAGGSATGGSSATACSKIDPEGIYLTGVVQPAMQCVGFAPVASLDAPCGVWKVSEGGGGAIRPDGSIVWVDAENRVRRYHPDPLDDGSPCASGGINDDEVIPTTCDAVGVETLFVDPDDGTFVYRCVKTGLGTSPWLVENAKSTPPDAEKVELIAVGRSGLKLVRPFGMTDLALLDAQGTQAMLSLPIGKITVRATAQGFLVAVAVASGDFELWSVAAGGPATKTGTYSPAPPIEQGLTRSTALAPDGVLWEVWDAPSDTVLDRRTVGGTTEILAKGSQPPGASHYVSIYAAGLITGP
jgi:hypothetical protein